MTRIKPTVSLFSIWQRELNRVPIRFTILYINYYCGYTSCLPQFSCSPADLCCDCNLWLCAWCDLSHDTFPHSTLVIREKKRKEKEILNNDLAILLSYDSLYSPMGAWPVVMWVNRAHNEFVKPMKGITNGHLLICDWCFRILKGSKMRSLDSDKRCC